MSESVVSGTAVKEVAALAKEAAEPKLFKFGSRQYGNTPLHEIKTDPKLPSPLRFYSLDALIGYLKWGMDATPEGDEDGDAYALHVVSPRRVDVVSELGGDDNHLRVLLASAEYEANEPLGFRFNAFSTLEILNIALLTCFDPEVGQIAEIRKLCASVRDTQELGVDDDGVSQTVKAKSGIAAVMDTAVRNPWHLAPWRTFPDIDQPTSPYVLRFKKSDGAPGAGLFETGNADWVLTAVSSIAEYLRGQLPGWTVLG